MPKKRTNNLFFTKNRDIFTATVSFAHIAAMSQPGFKTEWSETETKRDETLGLRDRDFKKRVSRHVSRYPPLALTSLPTIGTVLW